MVDSFNCDYVYGYPHEAKKKVKINIHFPQLELQQLVEMLSIQNGFGLFLLRG